MLAGAALAAVHAFFCINLRADQIVVGTGINFLALGITGYAFVDIYGEQGSPTDVPTVGSPSLTSSATSRTSRSARSSSAAPS